MSNQTEYEVVVEEFPAYRVVARRPKTGPLYNANGDLVGVLRPEHEVVELRFGDRVGYGSGRGYYFQYDVGGVIAYALQYNEDPISRYERAKSRGESLVWLGLRATAITAHHREQYTLIDVYPGMKVYLAGKLYEVRRHSPHSREHLDLIELTTIDTDTDTFC